MTASKRNAFLKLPLDRQTDCPCPVIHFCIYLYLNTLLKYICVHTFVCTDMRVVYLASTFPYCFAIFRYHSVMKQRCQTVIINSFQNNVFNYLRFTISMLWVFHEWYKKKDFHCSFPFKVCNTESLYSLYEIYSWISMGFLLLGLVCIDCLCNMSISHICLFTDE